MKVIFDKTQNNFKYPVSHGDIKLLFQLIPNEWKRGIKIIHFLGREPHESQFERPVKNLAPLSNKLKLSVMGLTEAQIITEILVELEQKYSHRSLMGNALSKKQLQEINQLIAPYKSEYLKQKDSEKESA